MSIAIGHFAFGVICTALLFAVVVPQLLYSPTLLLLGGVWAMIPDSHWVLLIGATTMSALHNSIWANIFWFHGILDRVDPTDSYIFAAVLVGLMLVVVTLSEWYARSTTRTSL